LVEVAVVEGPISGSGGTDEKLVAGIQRHPEQPQSGRGDVRAGRYDLGVCAIFDPYLEAGIGAAARLADRQGVFACLQGDNAGIRRGAVEGAGSDSTRLALLDVPVQGAAVSALARDHHQAGFVEGKPVALAGARGKLAFGHKRAQGERAARWQRVDMAVQGDQKSVIGLGRVAVGAIHQQGIHTGPGDGALGHRS